MKAYDKFCKESEKNNWNKLCEFPVKSFVADRFEIWLDKTNQTDYIVQILKNGDLNIYKYDKYIEEKK
jgi:hypothetical protein